MGRRTCCTCPRAIARERARERERTRAREHARARARARERERVRLRKVRKRCLASITVNGARHGLEDSKDEKGDDITAAPVLNIAIKKRKKAMKDNREDDDYDMEEMKEDGEEDGDNGALALKLAAKNKRKSKKGAKEDRSALKVAERRKRPKKHEEITRKNMRGAGVGEKT